ncbi:uncharacterized protein FIESC28_07988 [Fusarium coffeatum]|uniref:Uncharacterized protein n=1 Tax=Fusarium coffeatum TaxID=231269 RepID=A0A366RB25_9HYPO|nr:uncharacterized protein FIESC28_07988 [Fusarium coffeatum]RBR14022.1 hypothetical protein FIESC28_07988 [Fusarium coffeatum]
MEEKAEQPPHSGKISPEECNRWWDPAGYLQKEMSNLWLASLITYTWFYLFLKANVLLPVSPATKRPNSWGWWWLSPIALIELSTALVTSFYLDRANKGIKKCWWKDDECLRTQRLSHTRDTFATAMNDVLTYLYFGATSIIKNGPFKVDHPRILMMAEMFSVIAASTIFTITSLWLEGRRRKEELEEGMRRAEEEKRKREEEEAAKAKQKPPEVHEDSAQFCNLWSKRHG